MATPRAAAKKAPEATVAPAAAQRVIVQGMARRMQVFNLPHEYFCEALGECRCSKGQVRTSVHDNVEGIRRPVVKERSFCPTLVVRFRQRVAVERAALACPEVKAALTAKPRLLRVTK
jgi:hypothetical protein